MQLRLLHMIFMQTLQCLSCDNTLCHSWQLDIYAVTLCCASIQGSCNCDSYSFAAFYIDSPDGM